jgi:hypothetical protein
MVTNMKKVRDQTAFVGNDPTILVHPNLMLFLGRHARIMVQVFAERTICTSPDTLVMMKRQDENGERERNQQKDKQSLAGRILKEGHWYFLQRL